MTQWNPFPYPGVFAFDAASLTQNWIRLHQGDCEPLPMDAAVLRAWVLFHNGEFQNAAEAGLKAGGDGITGGQQGHLNLCQLPGKQGKTQARFVPGGGAKG